MSSRYEVDRTAVALNLDLCFVWRRSAVSLFVRDHDRAFALRFHRLRQTGVDALLFAFAFTFALLLFLLFELFLPVAAPDESEQVDEAHRHLVLNVAKVFERSHDADIASLLKIALVHEITPADFLQEQARLLFG